MFQVRKAQGDDLTKVALATLTCYSLDLEYSFLSGFFDNYSFSKHHFPVESVPLLNTASCYKVSDHYALLLPSTYVSHCIKILFPASVRTGTTSVLLTDGTQFNKNVRSETRTQAIWLRVRSSF